MHPLIYNSIYFVMRNHLLSIILMGICVAWTSCSSDDDETFDSVSEKTEQKKTPIENDAPADEQEDANVALENLLNSFEATRTRATGKYAYPDYYGGAYIDDNGKLVVYITKGFENNTRSAVTRASGTDNVTFRTGNYSYRELNEVMDVIDSKVFTNGIFANLYPNVVSACIDDVNNCIRVNLLDVSASAISDFKSSVTDAACIKFKKAQSHCEFTSMEVNAGSMVFSSATALDALCTIGYRVTSGTKVGFVTSGHAIDLGGKLYKGGRQISICTASNFNGDVDAAFCEVNDTSYFKLTNSIAETGNKLSTTISEPGTGTVVNMYGMKSNHVSGKVTSTRASCDFTKNNDDIDPVNFTNIVEVQMNDSINYGDSGGPFYSYISKTKTRLTLGILMGRLKNTKTVYYCKANRINTILGVKRY